MAETKKNIIVNGNYFNDVSPEREEPAPVKEATPEPPPKYKKQSIEEQTGRRTVHINALLFADDLDELREIAYQRRMKTSELIREVLSEYVQKNRE